MTGPQLPPGEALDALCLCGRRYVVVSAAQVKAGAVYCSRCAPDRLPAGFERSERRRARNLRRAALHLLVWNQYEQRYNAIEVA